MAKASISLREQIKKQAELSKARQPSQAVPAVAGEPFHVTSDNVQRSNLQRGKVDVPEGFKVRQRIEKPHVSVYLHPRVIKQVRDIATAENRKPHDIYVEGLRMALQGRGYDMDAIERGE